MASSKNPPKNNLAAGKKTSLLSQLKLFLRDFLLQQKRIQPSLLVAYSGGLDSTVLLHALHQLQTELPIQLRAMHVHHGLSENADNWVSFCKQTCADLNIPFKTRQVRIDDESRLGVEAAARAARYQALSVEDSDYVCLGHHEDDQAETLLLQLARGAGVKGLAGMAKVDIKRRFIRPLLSSSRADLMAYAKQHKLQWIEDDSNADTRFDRNFLRHELMPVFNRQYPSISQTLARSASHMAQASELLDDLAKLDAEVVIDQSHQYGALRLDGLNVLREARQANLVRWWLANNQIDMPSTALLTQILKQLQSKKTDAAIKVKVTESLYVMRYKALAFLVQEPKSLTPINLLWQGEEVVILPNLSRLFFRKKIGEGIAYKRGGSDLKLRIKNREGGERFLPELGRPRRGLKTIMQSIEMPPWQREQLPLIFMDETLAIIPNVGVDANLIAKSHEPGLVVSWQAAIS
ncbi:MAG: tRNA lysidine(34) synthetase TilS [Methylophilaceae bacterium]